MSVENAESLSNALWQDSKSLNELLKTTDISVCHICIIEISLTHIEEQLQRMWRVSVMTKREWQLKN